MDLQATPLKFRNQAIEVTANNTIMSISYLRYLHTAQDILKQIEATQTDAIAQASDMCAESIAEGGLVYLFGSGHSRMAVEEMFPRYGSFPGFFPIVELAVTYHNQVVGCNGQRQALFLENISGYAEVILRNFSFGPHDCMLVFSNSGTNILPIEIAMGAKTRHLPVIAVSSLAHSHSSTSKHTSGKRLFEIADLTIDNCNPPGDAVVEIPNLAYPVGPTSSIGTLSIVNAIKCRVAELLTERGQPPVVLTGAHFLGPEESAKQIERAYDDYKARVHGS
jgi:uncharacterized phosphosugar-binding protein